MTRRAVKQFETRFPGPYQKWKGVEVEHLENEGVEAIKDWMHATRMYHNKMETAAAVRAAKQRVERIIQRPERLSR